MALTMLVLPAPDGPKRAVTADALLNRASRTKSPSCLRTATSNTSTSDARSNPPRKQLGNDERRERKHNSDGDQACGICVAAGHLRVSVDRRRQCASFARNVGDEGDGGAELAERFGEAEHKTRENPGERKWQGDGEKHERRARAERAGGVFE